MNTKFFFKSLFLIATVGLLNSCDKDFTEVGSELIDDNHFDFERDINSTVVAYTQGTGAVQTNFVVGTTATVTTNPLGLLKNAAFGTTKANFVSQVQLATLSPVFGENIIVDDVKLSIPYFSRRTATSETGAGTFVLDSVKGTAPIKLSVFESGYYINDLDPDPQANFQSTLNFYNDDQRFENYRKGALEDGTTVFNGPRLNNSATKSQNDEFVFSNQEIVVTKTDDEGNETTTRSAPALRLDLNKNFFRKKIIEAPASVLNSQNAFKDYFRGVYFQVEQSVADAQGAGSLANLDFTKGNITISYTEDLKSTNSEGVVTTTRVEKTVILNFTGNRISLLQDSQNNDAYLAALNAVGPDTPTGDEKLYLKGGQGALAVIDLFGEDLTGDPVTGLSNGVADELEEIRTRGWLVNEASLTFYVDTDNVNPSFEPQRVYLYDLTNRRPLLDYATDATTNSINLKNSRFIYGGILEKETKNGVTQKKYKIRITKHINNLINNDSTNVRLGLVVTEGINETRNSKIKTPITLSDGFKIDRLPFASVLNPLGTILWGNTPQVPEDKRLKLEIYYTKQKPN